MTTASNVWPFCRLAACKVAQMKPMGFHRPPSHTDGGSAIFFAAIVASCLVRCSKSSTHAGRDLRV
eukprot:scaffold141986_cov29-Tisochrysis_lutea.AAC.3